MDFSGPHPEDKLIGAIDICTTMHGRNHASAIAQIQSVLIEYYTDKIRRVGEGKHATEYWQRQIDRLQEQKVIV